MQIGQLEWSRLMDEVRACSFQLDSINRCLMKYFDCIESKMTSNIAVNVPWDIHSEKVFECGACFRDLAETPCPYEVCSHGVFCFACAPCEDCEEE